MERYSSMPLLEPLLDLEQAKPVLRETEPVCPEPSDVFLDNNFDAHQRAIKIAVEAAARHNAALAAAKAAKKDLGDSSGSSHSSSMPSAPDICSEVHKDAVVSAREAARLHSFTHETIIEQASAACEGPWPCDSWDWSWGCGTRGLFLVFIEGIPEAICASPAHVSAMFEQAGLKNHLVSFEVPDPASGEVWVCLSSWEAMQCCVRHFRGCLWAPVTASAVGSSQHADGPNSSERCVPDSARSRECWADLSDDAEEDLPFSLRHQNA